MGKVNCLLLILIVFTVETFSQADGFLSFRPSEFLAAPPGAVNFGLYGYENPALLNYVRGLNMQFSWTQDKTMRFRSSDIRSDDLWKWGLFTAWNNFGFGMANINYASGSETNYKISFGAGSRELSLGLSYGWTNGTVPGFKRTDISGLGILLRPNKYISAGANGQLSHSDRSYSVYLDFAVRPLGTDMITLFGDYNAVSLSRRSLERDFWSAGTAVKLTEGLLLSGRYFDSGAFSFGLEIGLGNAGVASQANYDDRGNFGYSSYSVRLGSDEGSLLRKIFPVERLLNISINDEVKYRRFRFFDNSVTLFDVLQQIKAAKEDPEIAGIALNAANIRLDREKAWELHHALLDFRKSGKKVVVFLERPGMNEYHMASAADKIVLDPKGMITLQGYVMGRTYLKNTLEKIGIGFDEWRFFTYKSAMEDFARESMSEADREQRQALLDGFYHTMRSDVTAGRMITNDEFDDIINNAAFILPKEAVTRKLCDTLGRWSDANEILKKLLGDDLPLTDGQSLAKFNTPSQSYWGGYDYIAIVYAQGACAMESGINARSLVKDVEAVTNNPKIKAVILRVDSPGGDGMASDYISEALKKCMQKKPVIISQGTVAASGGYWLSMYSDTILAAPNTITGSIGVIGGWAYNKGLKEKLGASTDFVKSGEHAELGFGAAVPFIGLTLPDRNLTREERARMEMLIKDEYKSFVEKVAEGRKLPAEYIDSIGRGRVWTGAAGLQNRLVDNLGGMREAIELAKKMAGLSNEEDIRILQYPEMPLFNLSFLQPRIFGVDIKENQTINDILFRLNHNGQALFMLPSDYLDLAK